MAIRLLTKDQIAKAQATDKAKEIAEGLKISQRVDSLRELVVTEEETLAKFRDESLAAIQRDIEKAQQEKDGLETEVQALREEKERGLGELEDVHKEFDLQESRLTGWGASVDKKFSDIETAKKEAQAALSKAHGELERAQSHRSEAESLHLVAADERAEAQRVKDNADRILAEARAFKQESEQALREKELSLKGKEKELITQQEENEEKELRLSTERLQIADQRATLERAMKRFNKHG